jgi:hypothetical protein
MQIHMPSLGLKLRWAGSTTGTQPLEPSSVCTYASFIKKNSKCKNSDEIFIGSDGHGTVLVHKGNSQLFNAR